MKTMVPRTADDLSPLVIRTDYSDEAAWRRLVSVLAVDGTPEMVDDPAFEGATPAELASIGGVWTPQVVFVADEAAMRDERPLLAFTTVDREDFGDEIEYEYHVRFGREFRVVAGLVDVVHGNLDLANVDFCEFAQAAAAHPDNTYRGFHPPEGSPSPEQWEGFRAACDGVCLRRGETLRNAKLVARNGRFRVVNSSGSTTLQDGKKQLHELWPRMENGSGVHLDSHGFLQGRDYHGNVLWQIPRSGTALVVRDHGAVELVDEGDHPVWSSHCLK